jgi:hypothetical protein
VIRTWSLPGSDSGLGAGRAGLRLRITFKFVSLRPDSKPEELGRVSSDSRPEPEAGRQVQVGPSGILYPWYKVVQGGVYWYEPVHTLVDTLPYKKPQIGTRQYVLP